MLQDRKPSLVTRRKLASQLRHRRDVARRLTVETLESRQLLAGFVSGSIQGQDNWSGGTIAISPNVVQTVDQSGSNAHAGIGAWRVSNSTANGGYNGNFNGWPFSAPLAVAAGQPSSLAGADQFNATFFFKAGSSGADGSRIEIDLGSTAGDDRNNFLALVNHLDAQGGLQLLAAEPDGVTGNFQPTQVVASGLSRTTWHRIDVVAKFYNGQGNDTFQAYLDGAVLINPLTAGTTFGTFEGWRDGNGFAYVQSNRLFWRSGMAPNQIDASFSNTAAQGFFFDDVSYSVSQQSAPSTLLASYSAAFEPVGATVNTSYVKNSWAGTPLGVDPDGAGPATAFGYDAFASIQAGIDGTTAGGTVNVLSGTYVEDVSVNKAGLRVLGAGPGVSIVSGPIGGAGATFTVGASNIEVAGFTITREGNNAVDFNNPSLNFAGVAVQGVANGGLSLHDNLITGNRSGIDVNNSSGHTIRNNVITQNHTGVIFRNQTDNLTVVENVINDNRTLGVLFLDASGGTNAPVQTALNSTFTNNSIAGNWYGQIVDRQAGGSLLAVGTNLKNFSGNWLGSAAPVVTSANSAELSYAALQPVALGGSAVPPGGQPDVAGAASGNFDITPLLTLGTDTNVETTPGRGTYGFQGNFANVTVTSQLAQTGATARIQEAVDRVAASSTINVLPGTYVENVLVNKNLSLLSTGGRAVTTIQGISGLGALGAVQIAPTTTAFQLGDTNKGFTVIGIDNGAPGIENAAIYFQGNHSNAIIRGNDIRANGDEGLTTEYGATISGFVIDGNIFSGKSFVGPNPDGLGTSQQFTLPNVPRPLVVIGGGAGGGNTSNITFTNNQITGTTGGLNTLAQEQGNLLVALDSNGATISGNTFQGTTSRNGVYSLRTRGPNTVVSGNSFFSTGLTPSVGHLFIQGTGQTIDAAFAANTFDTGVYVSGTNPGVIFSTLQSAIDAVAAGTTIQVPTDTYVENITINKNLTLNFAAGAAIQPVAGDALTITAGTTKIAGTVNTGVRPTIVATGATLGGTGKITGPVTVQSGGFMSPGNSPGIFSTGNYNQVGTLNIEIVNPAAPPPVAGTDYDQVDVTGTVTLTGALSVTLSGTLPVPSGTSFKIINNDDVDAVVGNFTGLANGSTFLVGAQNFAIFYNGGDGNDVVLVAVATLVPTVVYVEDTQWNGFVNGQAITDADFGTSGNQVGVFGYSAFKTIAAAQAAVAPGGTIVVRDGSYSEAVSLSGTLAMRLTGATELGTGSVTINSLTGVSANSLALGVVGSAASLVVGDTTSTIYAGTITGPGAITKTGTGTLSLTNSGSSYTGNTIINLGTLSVADVANSGANSPIGAGTTIQFGGGALDFTAAGVDSSNRAISLTANGGVNVSNAAGALTLSGAVTGNTQFTKFGPGTMSWQPATAAVSNLHISGGVLELDGSGTFSIGTILPGSSTGDGALATGSGTLNIKGAVVVNAANISGNNQGSTTGTINQSGTSDVNVSGMVRIGHWPNGGMGNYNLSAGTLDLTGSPSAQVNQGAVAEQNGVIYLGIDGSGSLTVTGGAITATAIVLDGRGDTAGTDTFTLSGGTVTLGNSSNATTIANSGIFVGNNNSNTTYQVNLGGAGGTLRAATNITSAVKMTLLGSGANAINIDTNGNSINLAGTLSGSGDLKKTGAGTLTLSNVVNTYTGVSTVNAGTLLINGAIANGAATDDVVVNSTGVLGGTGTINGAVLVNSGGTITAGTLGGVGTLTIISNLSFNGGTYGADFSTNSSDTLVVGGVIDLANAAAGAFAVNSQTGTPTDGNVYTLINNTAGGAIIDPPLTGAIEGTSVAIGGKTSYYTYTGGDGNNFTLTVVGGPTLSGAGALEVRRVINGLGDNIQLLQAGVIIDSRPLSGITGTYTVNGISAADSLLINYTNTAPASGFIPLNINFNGGAGGTDTLRILGGNFDLINHTFTNANNGSILMDPTVGANTTITYTGLEPVLMNVGTVTDVIFNLPVGADTAILEDDTELVANTSQIRSVVGPTFERTTFTHPTGSLTINGGASDVVQVAFVESLTAANLVVAGVTTIQAGNVVTSGNVTLNATGAISEYLPDGSADITANLLTMTAATGMDVDTAINTLSANNTTSGAVLVDDAGPLVINKLRNVGVVASRVSATGTITDSGIDFVDMAGFTTFAPGAGNDVLLDTVGNRLFEVEVPIARDVIFQDIGGSGIRLFTSNATGNYFAQTTGGGIIGTGPLTIGGTATFLTNGTQPVQLAGFGNDFQGQVNATGDDIYLNDINNLDLGTINSNASGMVVTAFGSITNSGPIIANTVPTFWTVTMTATTGSITLLNGGNDFNVLGTFAPAGSVQVFDVDEIVLRTSNVGVNLNVTTTGGAAHSITDDVGATLTVGGLATFTAGAANVILDSATNNFNVVAVVSSNNTFIRDVNSMALNLLNATTNIKLQAGGAITDSNVGANNLNAPSAELIAVSGIGSGNALEATISSLAAVNSTSGNIELANAVGGLLTITTVGGTVGVNNNGAGSVVISNTGSITVAANSSAGSALTLTAQSPVPTDAENIVVNAGVTVQSDGLIDFNAADNFNIPLNATLLAGGNVTLDSLDDLSVDPLGSTFDFFGNVDAANIAFNGSNTEDTFNIQLDSVGTLTHMDVDGNDPTIPTLPGDVLNIFGANLTLIVNGVGTGHWTAPGAAVLDYVEIETVVASGPYHLIIDMGAAGLLPYNSVDAMLDGTPSNELEIRVDVDDDARAGFGGVLAFNGPVTNIRSLAVRGSVGSEVFSLTQNANNLLPGETGGLNNSSPDATTLGGTFIAAGRTPSLSPPAIHFSGNGAGDADSLRFNLNLAENVGYFAKGAGAGDANVQGKMTVSFSSLEKFESDQFATGGSIVIDSSSYAALANLTITDLGSLTSVDGDNGFADVEFQNAGTVTIRSGSGEDVIDLVSIDSAGLTSVTLDADNFTSTDNPVYIGLQLPTYFASDTIRVRSLPNVPALLLGGQGGDLFQLFNGSNQTSQILGPITINGEDGNMANTFVDNDRLFMIASGDVGPANVLVTETFVEGLTGFVGVNDVTYSNIDYIDVTTTSGDDNITVDMDNGLSDMNIATVRGADGQDDFDVLGVENFVPNAPVRPKFTDLFLFGDGPDDQTRGDVFGKNQDIFPSLTVVINIRGGAPSPVAPAGNIPGDTLFLDMSLTSANATTPVLVDTVGKLVAGVGYVGSATSASHKPVLFNDIETFDVNDRPFEGNTNSGQTNVQRGDLYVRGQESAADRIILYHENPPLQQSRLRYNNTDMSGFVNQLPTQTSLGKFIAYGRGGDDQITISNSLIRDGELYGQLGNDYLAGSTNGGNDLLVGASGNDRLQGLGGNDIMWGDNQDGTGNGSDRLNGGVGNDILYGGGGIDTMYGEAGDDLVRGEDGNDILSGDAGNDIVVGGEGNDRVNGGAGRDIVIGGQGVDIVDGDAGDDIVIGDATSWDLRTPANDAALRALLFGPGVDFWNSANLYAARVSNMRSLISGNVFEETVTAKDTILGDLETDWYWDVSLNDILSGKLAIEAVN